MRNNGTDLKSHKTIMPPLIKGELAIQDVHLDEILTLDEAAKYLKVSRVYAGLLVKRGIPGVRPPLPHFRFDRIIRVDKMQLRNWLMAAPGEMVKRGRGRPKKKLVATGPISTPAM